MFWKLWEVFVSVCLEILTFCTNTYFVPAVANGPQSTAQSSQSSSCYFYFNTYYLFLVMIHFAHSTWLYLMLVFLFVHRGRRMQVLTFSTTTWSMDRSPPKSWLSSCVRGEMLFWEELSWWWEEGWYGLTGTDRSVTWNLFPTPRFLCFYLSSSCFIYRKSGIFML